MYDRRPSKSFLIFFFILGLYMFIVSHFPTTLEITHTELGIQAHIHRRAMIPPFKNIDVFIPNLEQAVIITENTSEGRPNYRVELEDVQGHCFPISPFFSSNYQEEKLLEQRINNSIKGKYNFKSKNIIEHTFLQQFGFFSMLISLIALIIPRQKKNDTNQQIRQKSKETSKNGQKTQVLPISHKIQQHKSEPEKYKNMNRPLTKEELSMFTTILVGILFLLMGIGIGSDGIPTKTIKIVPTETQINVYTHTKSTWPPFKSIDYSVKNVKHAVLTGKGSLSSFRSLELETYNGKYFHITAGSDFPSFRQNLKNRINDAIESRTPSTIVFRETPSLIEGIAFTIVGVLTILFGLFWHIKTKRNQKIKEANINDEQKKLLDVLQQHIQQKEQGLDTPRQQNKSKLEQEKYKNINDSIIK